jgi:hypothetical protein
MFYFHACMHACAYKLRRVLTDLHLQAIARNQSLASSDGMENFKPL